MAGTVDRILALKLVTDVGDINKQLKGVSGRFKGMASSAKRWGKAIAGAFVLEGIETLVGSLDDALEGFKAGEDAARNVGATWKRLGIDTANLGDTLDDLATSAINLGFDDAEVTRAFNTFLTLTGDAEKSSRLVATAMDLARARGISFARAVRIVSGDLDGTNEALRRNKGAARRWARNHPLEVGLGRISELWEEFVGQFSKGNVDKAFAAIGGIGTVINELIFGKDTVKGHVPGLVDRFAEIGRKLAPAILVGLAGLGANLQTFWDTEIATVDWAKAIGDAVGGAVELLLDNQNVAANLAVVAGALAAGMFVASVFATALAAVFAAPAMIGKGVVSAAVTALGTALSVLLNTAMFLSQIAIDASADALALLFSRIPTGPGSLINRAALGLGTAIQAALLAGVTVGLFIAIQQALQDVLNSVLPGGTRLRFNPDTGRMERYGEGGIVTRPTLALIGEKGPEAVVPLTGPHAGMGFGNITINVQAGVGDPVEIGRQVDRVLRAYRGRAGLAA